MFELKLRQFGDSLGIVLPDEVIDRLRAGGVDSLFLIESPDGGYVLTPYHPAVEQKPATAEEIVGRYRDILQALAK